ncbi:hypothetical protein [Gelidibacter gilvus]|uniref:Tetratricopeptide repeat protein n=1 Tax=Gelidibacter gilvus TaxID=59602 RepID=A0A4V1LNH1_9FLAO|nr:hypothetical protein [Gelidibacter gilvus]RXJ52750.1 hypothetical protein ESZ48_03395 [Gelidibacter gilvus]
MKKVLSLLVAVLFFTSSFNANASMMNNQIEDSPGDCFEMAMGIYEAAVFTWNDRARALELGAWVYEDCMESESGPY